jgi:hypothetical protein
MRNGPPVFGESGEVDAGFLEGFFDGDFIGGFTSCRWRLDVDSSPHCVPVVSI